MDWTRESRLTLRLIAVVSLVGDTRILALVSRHPFFRVPAVEPASGHVVGCDSIVAMATPMKKKSQDFWDRVSRRSNKPPKELSRTALKTVEATQRHLTSEKVVLDYGCGRGDLTFAIAQRVKAIHAIDTSSGMIDVARTRGSQLACGNVNFAQSSIFDEGHLEGAFTVVTAFNVLHYIEDTLKVSKRICNLLAPGGLFISSTACLGERRTLLGTLGLILIKLGIIPDTKFFKETELEDLIASGGFRIVETEELSRLPDYFIVAKKIEA